ncbi:APG6-domain-containing protein [Sarocladium strictum]
MAMLCQKCRQPLKLDGSLEDLNPAAYDLLVGSSTPKSPLKTTSPSSSRSPIPHTQESARKSLYSQASQNAAAPTFKRQSAGAPRDSTMSFIYLTESVMGAPASQPRDHPPTPTKMRRASSSRGDDQETPRGDEVDRMNRLFEILSARSDIDHPVCIECTDMLVDGLQKKLDAANRERNMYVAHLKEIQATQPTAAELKQQDASLKKAEADKASALAELRKLEAEKDVVDAEILALEEESRQVDKEEEGFWREHNSFVSEMAEFRAERDSVAVKYANDMQMLDKLTRTNVYNDTFCISHDGTFATINGLRLGRMSSKPVDWPEINAAWGHALLLIVTVADKLGYKFQGYDPQPLGSTSKIIKYETVSPASSRLTSHRGPGPPPKKHILELYSSGDMPLGLTFMHRKFDNAMVGFLELVRQLGSYVQAETEARGKMLGLPYAIEGDKIGDVSIKLGIAQDDGWTKACKLTLTCCKFLLAHASNVG